MIEVLLLCLLCGVLIGIFTGLTPGIHTNLIGVILVSLSVSLLSSVNLIYFVVFVVSMAMTHTFIDFIPSVFLGCPDTDTELSVLPGHELLKEGRGYEAIVLTAYGSLIAILILILIAFPSVLIIPGVYNYIKNLIPFFLIAVSIFLIFLEKKKIAALVVFILSGFLGYIVLNQMEINQPLLPLLTGLFGGSTLILSIKNKMKIPEQKIIKPKIRTLRPVFGAFVASPLCSFLPGLGSGQAAVIGNLISGSERENFLVLLGITNTLVMGFSFISLYCISKTRTGAAAAIQQIIGDFSWRILVLILIVVIISGIISFFLTIILAEFFSKRINKIDYTFLSLITLSILVVIVFLISGIVGVFILIISTFTGIYCISLKVRRTNMMGCLLIPTILLYFLG